MTYEQVLEKFNLTEAGVQKMMASFRAPIPNRHQDAAFEIRDSPIHGVGMFARRKIEAGEQFIACCGLVRYNLSRYVNHSGSPNAVLNFNGPLGMVSVLEELKPGDEITMDYADNLSKSLELLI